MRRISAAALMSGSDMQLCEVAVEKWNLCVTQPSPATFTGRCQPCTVQGPHNYTALEGPRVPRFRQALPPGGMLGTRWDRSSCPLTGIPSELAWLGAPGMVPFPIPLIFYSSRVGSFGCLFVWLILETVPIGGNYLFESEMMQRSRCRERTTTP